MKALDEEEQPEDREDADYTDGVGVVVPVALLGRSSGVHSYCRNQIDKDYDEAVTEAQDFGFDEGKERGPSIQVSNRWNPEE